MRVWSLNPKAIGSNSVLPYFWPTDSPNACIHIMCDPWSAQTLGCIVLSQSTRIILHIIENIPEYLSLGFYYVIENAYIKLIYFLSFRKWQL